MRVLVIGEGGREHALVWKLRQSDKLSTIFVAPGNPGTAQLAENINFQVTEIDQICNFCLQENIDLVIVGPEKPLAAGLVDQLEQKGIRVFGPTQAAAKLESSKSFAKEVMIAAGVPTAKYHLVCSQKTALEYINTQSFPIVLKADGLAAGKGVFVCHDHSAAVTALEQLYAAQSNQPVVIEQFIAGVEASLIVACNGQLIVPLPPANDYKRIFDNDQGPNTGGMGTVSPTANLTEQQYQWAIEHVIKPVLNELHNRQLLYKGFLYAGLMISSDGRINVLEFNCRLGDPETQVLLPRLNADLLAILSDLTDGVMPEDACNWSEASCVCVVLASKNYPESSSSGDIIRGLDSIENLSNINVFHAGTKLNQTGILVTNGGRILNVVANASSSDAARQLVYAAIEKISFEGMQYRRDIAKRNV